MTKLISKSELFPDDFYNIIRVGIGFSENQRFRNAFTLWKQLGEQIIPESVNDSTDLTGVDDIAVKLGRRISNILVHLRPSSGVRQSVAVFDFLFHDIRAVFCDVRFDTKNIRADIYIISDRFIVCVFADDVFMKIGERACVRRGGQTDLKGVEIF